MIKVKELNAKLAPFFYKYISNDEHNYYFFILDWKYSRENTKILIAQENRKIKGTMLVYKNSIFHIRGAPEVVTSLLNRIDVDNVEVTCYEEHKAILLDRYRPTIEHRLVLMKLEKENIAANPKYPIAKLSIEDAEETSNLVRDTLPDFWNQMTTESISSRIKEGDPCYCFKKDGKIVSIALAREKNFGDRIGIIGYINAVTTAKDHRNKGYATSMVSQLSKKLLERSKYVLLYVISDNVPAFTTYSRVGFKPVRYYYFMRGQRIVH
jgi:ribosomal protein S18 acetylase RimI-like enzyme